MNQTMNCRHRYQVFKLIILIFILFLRRKSITEEENIDFVIHIDEILSELWEYLSNLTFIHDIILGFYGF